jgi:hypothetical protein
MALLKSMHGAKRCWKKWFLMLTALSAATHVRAIFEEWCDIWTLNEGSLVN